MATNKSAFSFSLGKPGGKKVVIPTKTTMNFARKESSVKLGRVAPVALLVVLVVAIGAKVGILDLLDQKTAAYANLASKQEQLVAISMQLTEYDEVAALYGRYSYGWMDESETSLVDRLDVLDLIEEKLAYVSYVSNFSVNGNVLTLNLSGVTLDEISAIVRDLESSPMVVGVTVSSASAPDAEEASAFMTINLTRVEETEEVAE